MNDSIEVGAAQFAMFDVVKLTLIYLGGALGNRLGDTTLAVGFGAVVLISFAIYQYIWHCKVLEAAFNAGKRSGETLR